MKKKIDIKYNAMREFAKRIIIGNLGKVVEEEDKIICYVKKFTKQNGSYVIACRGINNKNKDLVEKYNLNKPIYYVIDNFKTKYNNVHVFGYDNVDIIIKNSEFNFGFDLQTNGNCELDNVLIKEIYVSQLCANQLNLKKVNIISCFSEIHLILESNKNINIIDSVIGDNKVNIDMECKEKINIIDSKINGKYISCNSPKMIINDKSLINSELSLNIETDDFDKINIMSPLLIYNKNVFLPEEEKVILEKINNHLKLNRLQLIEVLKEIKNECEESLYSQSVSKVLKK